MMAYRPSRAVLSLLIGSEGSLIVPLLGGYRTVLKLLLLKKISVGWMGGKRTPAPGLLRGQEVGRAGVHLRRGGQRSTALVWYATGVPK